jgi:hypothetical protein
MYGATRLEREVVRFTRAQKKTEVPCDLNGSLIMTAHPSSIVIASFHSDATMEALFYNHVLPPTGHKMQNMTVSKSALLSAVSPICYDQCNM